MSKISVAGMSCEHCVKHVANALKDAGLTNVAVDLASNSATFENDANIASDVIIAAVDEAGYTACFM